MSTYPPAAPKISYDLLLKVMDLLAGDSDYQAQRTIAFLSRTCKDLRVEGVRRLLSRNIHVNLAGRPLCVAPFCYFMLEDPPARLPLVRSLLVNVCQITEEHAQLLAEVLTRARHLEYLDLQSFMEVTIPVAVILCSAIAQLTSLKHLAVCSFEIEDPHCDRILYDALQHMQSQLVSVQLEIPPTKLPSENIIYTRRRDPICLLSGMSCSLRSIQFDGRIRVGGGIHVYPLVEELHIAYHEGGMPDLMTYLLCFPNLRFLRCGVSKCYWVRFRHTTDLLQQECCLATVQQ